MQLNERSLKAGTSRNSIHERVQRMHSDIRQKKVEADRRRMRQELLINTSENPSSLKNINLMRSLTQLMNISQTQISEEIDNIDEIAQNLVGYSSSQHSYHLYELMEFKHLQHLAQLIQWKNIKHFEKRPRAMVRIFHLLANYSHQSSDVPEAFLAVMQALLWHRRQRPGDLCIFSAAQYKQLVHLSFQSAANIGLKNQAHHQRFFSPEGYIQSALEENRNIIKKIKQEGSLKDKEQETLLSILHVYNEIFSYTNQQEEPLAKLEDVYYHMINSILQLLDLPITKEVEKIIASTFTSLFIYQLDTKPKILLFHNFQPIFKEFNKTGQTIFELERKISQHNKFFEVQGQTQITIQTLQRQWNGAEQGLKLWIKVVQAMYTFQIPSEDEKDEQKYYDIFCDWLEKYLLPLFCQAALSCSPRIQKVWELMLKILDYVCQEEQFLDLVLKEIPIMKSIIVSVRSQTSPVPLKKKSFSTLNSILITGLQSTQLRREVLDLCNDNELGQALGNAIGQFAEPPFNQRLLQAFLLLLECVPCEEPSENILWIRFHQSGGITRLTNMLELETAKNREVNRLAESILDRYDHNKRLQLI